MYCPSCGAQYEQKMNFCKRCGANMAPASNTIEFHLPRLRVTGMTWAIVLFSFVGLAISMTALSALQGTSLSSDDLVVVFAMSLLFVLSVAGMLGWQLARIVSIWQQAVQQSTQKAQQELSTPTQPALSPSATPPTLAAPREAVASVSEHTTRSFNPALAAEAGAREES